MSENSSSENITTTGRVKRGSSPSKKDPHGKIRKVVPPKRKYNCVSDEKRLQMIIMITEHGLTCYQSAKILGIPYTNAKVIYRTFRMSNKVVLQTRSKKRGESGVLDDNGSYIDQFTLQELKKKTIDKLMQSLQDQQCSLKIAKQIQQAHLSQTCRQLTILPNQETSKHQQGLVLNFEAPPTAGPTSMLRGYNQNYPILSEPKTSLFAPIGSNDLQLAPKVFQSDQEFVQSLVQSQRGLNQQPLNLASELGVPCSVNPVFHLNPPAKMDKLDTQSHISLAQDNDEKSRLHVFLFQSSFFKSLDSQAH